MTTTCVEHIIPSGYIFKDSQHLQWEKVDVQPDPEYNMFQLDFIHTNTTIYMKTSGSHLLDEINIKGIKFYRIPKTLTYKSTDGNMLIKTMEPKADDVTLNFDNDSSDFVDCNHYSVKSIRDNYAIKVIIKNEMSRIENIRNDIKSDNVLKHLGFGSSRKLLLADNMKTNIISYIS